MQATMNEKTSRDFASIPPAKEVGRKREVDASLLEPEAKRKLEVRRAYNRQCAALGTFQKVVAFVGHLNALDTTLNRLLFVLSFVYTQLQPVNAKRIRLVASNPRLMN